MGLLFASGISRLCTYVWYEPRLVSVIIGMLLFNLANKSKVLSFLLLGKSNKGYIREHA